MKYFALIDPALSGKAVKSLKLMDIEPLFVPSTALVEKPISGHPDIQIFIHHKIAFVHPDINSDFLKKLNSFYDVRFGVTQLSSLYPGDIAYNIAAAGEYAFHKKNSTDPVIVDYFKNNGISIIEVKQGYSKCSTMIVTERSIITSDVSIHNSAENNGFESLLISPGYINLPGYKYGFIGGASGVFNNMILFTGSIDHHPDRDKIYNYIEAKGLTVKLLSDEPAYDAGSILIASY